MEKRHENSLNDVLEEVAYQGFSSVAKWRINRWYGQINFTVTIRRDLRERWKKLGEELEWTPWPQMKIAEVDGDILFMRKKDFFPDNE